MGDFPGKQCLSATILLDRKGGLFHSCPRSSYTVGSSEELTEGAKNHGTDWTLSSRGQGELPLKSELSRTERSSLYWQNMLVAWVINTESGPGDKVRGRQGS